MSSFAQLQNRTQNRHCVRSARPDYANSRDASALYPFRTQPPAWGNQTHAMADIVTRTIQAKLTLNEPEDWYEREADRVGGRGYAHARLRY